MYDEICIAVALSLAEIYKHQLISAVIIYQPCCRINIKRSPAYDEHIRIADIMHRAADYIIVQCFLIKYDVRPYDAAAGASGYAGTLIYYTGIIRLAAS